MEGKRERRKWPRKTFSSSEFGIVHPSQRAGGKDASPEGHSNALLVLIINRSENGLLLKSPSRFEPSTLLQVQTRLPDEDLWVASLGEVTRADENPTDDGFYLLGVELDPKKKHDVSGADENTGEETGISPRDLDFFKQTQLFDAIPDEGQCRLLNAMTPLEFRAGERFIDQGTEGDTFYLVQKGSCVVNVEKDGVDHPVARRRAGDVLGEMALFTGEPRAAHVDAETDVKLWSMTKAQFDTLCEACPDAQDFLTELITHRLSRGSFTADRDVGKYVIHEIIGQGGWSIVYRGIHRILKMPVAIKMLRHDMAMDPDFSDKFRYEAKTIAMFNHENIVKVYDIEELYKTIFIIAEYLDGMPLDDILEKTPRLPVSRVLNIVMQVCAGLDYAHEQGIVHQDIKPANIFVQPNDRVKIVDFGLACSPGSMDSGLRGTIFYAPPEAIDGETVDGRADIFSLGITAFEMITGQKPYPEDDISKAIDLRLQEDIRDPREFVPDLPDELSEFIVRSTRRDPAHRYGNISEALADLQTLARKMEMGSQALPGEAQKMMSLFLFFQNRHEPTLRRLVDDFRRELGRIGAELRSAEFKDL